VPALPKEKLRIKDIAIFGICLFIILLLDEFEPEVGSTVRWVITTPLVFIGIYFGLRASAPPEDKSD